MNSRLATWLKGSFTENILYKAISAGLVLVLYVWVLGDRQGEVSFFAPVRVVVPEGRVLVSPAIDRVRVTVRGGFSSLQEISTEDLQPLLVDLEGKKDEDVVRFDRGLVSVGAGTRVVSIQPSFMRVSLAERAQRTVPVRARLVGEPPPGFVISSVTVKPQRLELSGPEDVVDRTRVALTEPIDVSGKEGGFTERVQLRHDSPLVRDDLSQPVEVTVAIERREVERTFRGLPVRVINTPRSATLSPESIDVTLRGPKSVIDVLERATLFASIDMSDVSSETVGTYQRRARLSNVPEGVQVKLVYPTEFQVTLVSAASP